jgi:hypothetical protein
MQGRFLGVIGFAIVALAGPAVQQSVAQQPPQPVIVDSYFPKVAARGQATVFTVAVGGRNVPQGIEVSPASGVTVGEIKRGGNGQGALGWWEITVNVAADAQPGPRTLTVVLPMGRTNAVPVTITSHAPTISALSIAASQTNQPTVDLQFTAADSAADLGEAPYVWFTMNCGPGQPEQGAVRGKMTAGTVRASIPNPRTFKGVSAPAVANRCDLQVRATDAAGTESNTLKTTVEFRN